MVIIVDGNCPEGGEPCPGQIVLEQEGKPGRFVAYRHRDARRVGVRRAGSEDARWAGSMSRGRRPYYGIVNHVGRQWVATLPGGHRVRTFATRAAAKQWLGEVGQWA